MKNKTFRSTAFPPVRVLVMLSMGLGASSLHAATLGSPDTIQVQYTLGESGADFATNFQDTSGNNRHMTGGAGVDYAVGTTSWNGGAVPASGSTASLMIADGKAKWGMSNVAGMPANYQISVFVDASDEWPNTATGGSAQTIFAMDGIRLTRQGGNYSGVVNGTTIGSLNAGVGWQKIGLMLQKSNDVFSFWTSTDGGVSWTQQGTDTSAPGLGDDWVSTHLFVKPGGGENFWGYADSFTVQSITLPPPPPPGGNLTWDNGAANLFWNTSDANWSGNTWTNAAICNAIFGSTGAGEISLGEPIQIGNLTVNSAGYSFVGNSLSLNDSIITANQPFTISSALSGYGLTKQGAETLTLNGTFSHTGTTTVGQGGLTLGTGGSLGNLTLEAGTTLTTAANSHAVTVLGDLVMGNGALLAATGSPDPVFGHVFFNSNGQQVLVSGDTTSTISAELHLVDLHTFQVPDGLADSDLLISGVISNHSGVAWGAVVKSGAGTLQLVGANGHGGNFLSEGTLLFSNGSLGNPGGPWKLARFTGPAILRWAAGNTQDISADGELAINDGVTATLDTNGNDITLGSPISVETARSGGFAKQGNGTLTLAAAQTYLGDTSVVDGTLAVSSAGSLRFRPSANGSCNHISGTTSGNLILDGSIQIELDAADLTDGNSWNLLDVGSFSTPPTYGGNFLVTSNLGDFTESSAGVWTKSSGANTWTFLESSGVLSLAVSVDDYATWSGPGGYNLSGDLNADDDGDGLSNHTEYAFGLNPTSSASATPITGMLNKTSGKFTYTRRDPSLTPLNYTVRYSTDLSTWTETNVSEFSLGVSSAVETVEVTLPPSLLAEPKLFIQVMAN